MKSWKGLADVDNLCAENALTKSAIIQAFAANETPFIDLATHLCELGFRSIINT